MDNISIAIVTDDKMYGKALGVAILNICGTVFLKICSWEEFLQERNRFYEKDSSGVFSNRFDIILWDGEADDESYGGKIILLTADPVRAVRNYQEKKFSLYKYTSAQTMVSAIFDIYSFLTGRRAVNIRKNKVRMITFASCAGGTGCTAVAMSVGQELCRFQGKRVLYVSFEEIESTGVYISSPAGVKGAGVYLYHLFRNKKGNPFMESYTVHDDFGIEAFAPTAGRNPLRNLDQNEFCIFIASLIDCGRYDVIITDVGNCLSEAGITCLDMTEKVCLVSSREAGETREIQYLQHLICCCGEGIMDKIIKAENKVTDREYRQKQPQTGNNMIETEVKISRFKEMGQSGGISRVILEDRFGDDIKILTEKIMEPSGEVVVG